MTDDFVRNRITQLRLQKGVSEYQMSYDLGYSRVYVYIYTTSHRESPCRRYLSCLRYATTSASHLPSSSMTAFQILS